MSKLASTKQRIYIANLRAELGIDATDVPATSRGASQLIDVLRRRRESATRPPAPAAPVRKRRSYRVADGSAG